MKNKKCLECGSDELITQEHVISQAFYKVFRKGEQLTDDFYIKVPLCETHNNLKSHEDEMFVHLMVKCSAHLHPEANKLIPRVRKGIHKNRIYLEELNDINFEPAYNELSGELLAKIKNINFEVFKYLKKIAIYILVGHLEVIKPSEIDDYQISTIQFNPLKPALLNVEDHWIKKEKFTTFGNDLNGIFQYMYKQSEPGVYLIILSFFQFQNTLTEFRLKI